MKFLITNDDGIDAPGIAALAEAASDFGEVVMVGPRHHMSGCSHRVTADGGLRIEMLESDRFAVDGTPADCVRIGLFKIVPDADWVLSGINAGGNIGVDVHLSGTVAAAREAAFHGRAGAAFSYYRARGHEFQWRRAIDWTRRVFRRLLAQSTELGHFWNVNYPSLPEEADLPEIVLCPVDRNPLPLSYRAENGFHFYSTDYHQRPRDSGTDMDVCFSGRIAVSKIAANVMHHPIHKEPRTAF